MTAYEMRISDWCSDVCSSDLVRGASLAALAFILPSAGFAQDEPESKAIVSDGNPILADGRTYSTDPAPLVVSDTLYILAGRDEAPPDVNDFIMKDRKSAV